MAKRYFTQKAVINRSTSCLERVRYFYLTVFFFITYGMSISVSTNELSILKV